MRVASQGGIGTVRRDFLLLSVPVTHSPFLRSLVRRKFTAQRGPGANTRSPTSSPLTSAGAQAGVGHELDHQRVNRVLG